VDAGEKLTVPEGAAARRQRLSPYGGEWEWVELLAPPFATDGRSVGEISSWVAEQTGRELAFATPAAERIAQTSVVRGSIDLAPLPKLAAVLATADLDYTLDGGTILIRAR
jgi:hypothetical protein